MIFFSSWRPPAGSARRTMTWWRLLGRTHSSVSSDGVNIRCWLELGQAQAQGQTTGKLIFRIWSYSLWLEFGQAQAQGQTTGKLIFRIWSYSLIWSANVVAFIFCDVFRFHQNSARLQVKWLRISRSNFYDEKTPCGHVGYNTERGKKGSCALCSWCITI